MDQNFPASLLLFFFFLPGGGSDVFELCYSNIFHLNGKFAGDNIEQTSVHMYLFIYYVFICFSCHQVDQMGQKDMAVEDEVRYRYNSVIVHYRKSFIQDNAQRYMMSFFIYFDAPT